MIRRLAIIYVGLAILANWLASKYIVTVPFTGGLRAPAGIFAVGAILILRDWLQQIAGLWRSLALVYLAGVLSYLAGEAFGWTSLTRIAIASVVAFTVSETIEAAVFSPIRRRNLTAGVASSAVVANAVDSWLFLTIAFGWVGFAAPAFFYGQVFGKLEMIAVGVVLTATRRRWLPTIGEAA